jgi:hypothetical protein
VHVCEIPYHGKAGYCYRHPINGARVGTWLRFWGLLSIVLLTRPLYFLVALGSCNGSKVGTGIKRRGDVCWEISFELFVVWLPVEISV